MSQEQKKRKTRKQFLNEICEVIFGIVKANYTESFDSIIIQNKSGLADKCKFDSVSSLENYRHRMERLLRYTFLDQNVEFEIRGLTREKAVDNAVAYLKNRNVNTDLLISNPAYKRSKAQTVYIVFSEIIIPAIFDAESSIQESPPGTVDQDITEEYNHIPERCMNWILKQLVFISDTQALTIENCIIDKRYYDYEGLKRDSQHKISDHLHQCNYAIPIYTSQLLSAPRIEPLKLQIYVSHSILSDDNTSNTVKDFVSGFYRIGLDQCYASTNNMEKGRLHRGIIEPVCLPFSGKRLEEKYSKQDNENYLIDDVYYLITRIDDGIISYLQSQPEYEKKSPADIMLSEVKNKILSDNLGIRRLIREKAKLYAERLRSYIEDVVQKIELLCCDEFIFEQVPSSVNNSCIVRIITSSISDYEPDSQDEFGFLESFDFQNDILNKMPPSFTMLDKWNWIYSSFNKVLSDLLRLLVQPKSSKGNTELTSFIKRYSLSEEVEDHISVIKQHINSRQFQHAIGTEEETNAKVFRSPNIAESRPLHGYLFGALHYAFQAYIDELQKK